MSLLENKEVIKGQLNIIESSELLTKKFRVKYGTDFKLIKATIDEDLIKLDAIKYIFKVAPLCLDINKETYLVSNLTPYNSEGEFDIETKLFELNNMSMEMNKGVSTSIFTSDISIFKKANIENIELVSNFLDNLRIHLRK